MSLPDQIADEAEQIVNTLTQTSYQHTDNIIPATGVYDCDCNGFVGYVLSLTAPSQLALIPLEPGLSRPRAFAYFDFFAALSDGAASGWQRIENLTDAMRGDIMTWRSPTIEAGADTGHVVIIAEPPTLDPSGTYYVMRVYDSANAAHFEDTRAPSGVASPKGATGVGSGFINFKVDGVGRPLAYLFAPPLTGQFSYKPIAIARLSPS